MIDERRGNLAARGAARLFHYAKAAFVGALCLSQAAQAQSLTVNGFTNEMITLPAAVGGTVGRDRAAGSSYRFTSMAPELRASGLTCGVSRRAVVNSTPVPGYTNVFPTNVPRIGMRFMVSESSPAIGGGMGLQTVTNTPLVNNFTFSNPFNSAETNSFQVAIEYIVLAGPTGGTITSSASMQVTWTSQCGNFSPVNIYFVAPHNVMTFTHGTCSVDTPTVNVALPAVLAKDLQPVGTAAGNQPFNIRLTCVAGIPNVRMTMTDVSNPANRSNLLGLASGSTAGGVKLRILQSGAPISFGADSAVYNNQNQFTVISNSTSAQATVPFTAQYFSTGAVTGGSVKAAATFTMSYQ